MNRLKKQIKEQEKKDKIIYKKSKWKKWIIFGVIILIIALAIRTAISVHNWQVIAKQMLVNQPSKVLDSEQKEIATIGSSRKRKNVSSSQIPQNLKDAYVSIEDERFYRHHGVDVKRTSSAIFSYVIHFGKTSFGASTITQQLVKNLTGDDSNKISRKIKEWGKATALEWEFDKDEILDGYLNIIYVGPNIYGVEMGSQYYFNKSVSDLNLAECAFLAGINNAPNAYNPFLEEKDNSEKIKKRTKTVLYKMLELEKIGQEEYEQAVQEVENGLAFKKGKIESSDVVYSYHTEALLSEIITDMAKEMKITETFATNYLYMANLQIYSTQKSSIQKEVETEFEKNKYRLKSADGKDTSQAAMVIIDNETGAVVACARWITEKRQKIEGLIELCKQSDKRVLVVNH